MERSKVTGLGTTDDGSPIRSIGLELAHQSVSRLTSPHFHRAWLSLGTAIGNLAPTTGESWRATRLYQDKHGSFSHEFCAAFTWDSCAGATAVALATSISTHPSAATEPAV